MLLNRVLNSSLVLICFSLCVVHCKWPSDSASRRHINGTGDSLVRNTSAQSAGTYGCDVSSLISPSVFQCLKGEGYEFVIVRAYRSDCKSLKKPSA